MRQIVLDTETTGLELEQGHRIIEIGCVELEQRRLTGRRFHAYLNPGRDVDEGALDVHGLSTEFLADKPVFGQIVDDFLAFIGGAELLIHNAPFDIGFLDHELALLGAPYQRTADYCSIVDTLIMARKKHPGQRNSLDALCKRYAVDNSQRDLHGALLDAEILADVYLRMSGGQTRLSLGERETSGPRREQQTSRVQRSGIELRVIHADAHEQAAHQRFLERIHGQSARDCLWLEEAAADDADEEGGEAAGP